LTSNFNKSPEVKVDGCEDSIFAGWPAIISKLKEEILKNSGLKKILVVECYQGIDDKEVFEPFAAALPYTKVIDSRRAFHSESRIVEMTFPDVTDDRIFGYMTSLTMEDFFDPNQLHEIRHEVEGVDRGVILIYGPGSSLIYNNPDLLVYADMPRWEIQLRMRRNEVSNLGISNKSENIEEKYKRGYFVDWRVCDRLKRIVWPGCHWILDTTRRNDPAMVSARAYENAMSQAVSRPFSVVPYFDAGPWGGQWMKETFDIGKELPNLAWCFNCVPEENTLCLNFGGRRFETPSINLVFFRPDELLGNDVRQRFGEEFPIRFDFLDTMQGGNLSLQVHPLTGYIREYFGQPYTQDESYYLVEAGEGARVYLGLKQDVDPGLMIHDLRNASQSDTWFDDKAYIQSWPARKHDHFLIPGGTVHCSGKDCMVLEISSTPYIFTFKLWDWGRLGLDGKPRPINIGHGMKNIQWNRQEKWVSENLVNRFVTIGEGEGWSEEKTGLHELEFIETRRHRFTSTVKHHTHGGVNVIALVEGREIVVESPAEAFDPFVVHFAETFIVPAATGTYTIRPHGESIGAECVTIKAYVRNYESFTTDDPHV